jgi:hypothetical protein
MHQSSSIFKGCHDDYGIRDALNINEDESDIVRMLQVVLNCDSDKKAVLRLRGNEADANT